jgi:hypothetical protein
MVERPFVIVGSNLSITIVWMAAFGATLPLPGVGEGLLTKLCRPPPSRPTPWRGVCARLLLLAQPVDCGDKNKVGTSAGPDRICGAA